jgi:hypothetical protein
VSVDTDGHPELFAFISLHTVKLNKCAADFVSGIHSMQIIFMNDGIHFVI